MNPASELARFLLFCLDTEADALVSDDDMSAAIEADPLLKYKMLARIGEGLEFCDCALLLTQY